MLAGLAISVASTVVLVRMLVDHDLLQTTQGHIAVGWLIVEDIFTVIVLVALPAWPALSGHNRERIRMPFWRLFGRWQSAAAGADCGWGRENGHPASAAACGGHPFSRTIHAHRARHWLWPSRPGRRSGLECRWHFGAFLAGMVVGQTEVSHQAAADASAHA